MKYTIGMAHHSDFHGVYFTIQALRLYFPHIVEQAEFIIVNNGPENNHSKMIAGLAANVKSQTPIRLIQQTDPVGTSPARNRIFAEAQGDYVIAMDCHVLMQPGSLEALNAYYNMFPDTKDIISGPMIYDNIVGGATHFNDEWRSEMWGTWGMAWECDMCGEQFSLVQDKAGKTQAVKLDMGRVELVGCQCGRLYPSIPWPGHEKHFMDAQYSTLMNAETPFDIPGMGLGFFSQKRSNWLGFNPHARAFGGEELYYHSKVRQHGGEAICIPQLKWLHRFGRPDGVPYPLDMYNKIRNYVLEFQELGMDIAPVRNHFVGENKITAVAWEQLLRDPIRQTNESASPCPGCQGPSKAPVPVFDSIDEIFDYQTKVERDLNQHMPKLRELAAACNSITEFSHRRDSTIAFLAGISMGNPNGDGLVSYNTEVGPLVAQIVDMYVIPDNVYSGLAVDSPQIKEIEETDLLFLDTVHTYDRVTQELGKFASKVNRFIVFHDTVSFGKTGDDGGAGLIQAISDFLKANTKWALIYHTEMQYGLTVLGCRVDDVAKPVSGWNLGFGPGTELKKLLSSIGINPAPGCSCLEAMRQMDAWGWLGCANNTDWIVADIRTRADEWGWGSFFTAAALSLFSGLAFKINPLDPIPSLVQIAIDRSWKD